MKFDDYVYHGDEMTIDEAVEVEKKEKEFRCYCLSNLISCLGSLTDFYAWTDVSKYYKHLLDLGLEGFLVMSLDDLVYLVPNSVSLDFYKKGGRFMNE